MLFFSQKSSFNVSVTFLFFFFIVCFICISPFLQVGHRGQPYTSDIKVKNFIRWIKTKTDSEIKNTVIGGYYPYPPVPETFSKYSRLSKGTVIIASSSI